MLELLELLGDVDVKLLLVIIVVLGVALVILKFLLVGMEKIRGILLILMLVLELLLL